MNTALLSSSKRTLELMHLKTVVKVFEKDLRILKIPICFWLCLLVFNFILQDTSSGRKVGVEEALGVLLAYVFGFVLTGAVVGQDPLVGTKAFWKTKPISGWELLAAKALFVGLLITIPLFLVLNLQPTMKLLELESRVTTTAGLSLIIMAGASLFQNPRSLFLVFILWWIFGGLLTLAMTAWSIDRIVLPSNLVLALDVLFWFLVPIGILINQYLFRGHGNSKFIGGLWFSLVLLRIITITDGTHPHSIL